MLLMRFKSKDHDFTVKVAIFDIDDTLLNDWPNGIHSLHQEARVMAANKVGKKFKIEILASSNHDIAKRAYITAPEHNENSIVWQTLILLGIVSSDKIDSSNIIYKELIYYKHKYYEDLLIDNDYSFEGSVVFVKKLATDVLGSKLSIASNARKADIDTFLVSSKLKIYFKEKNIVSKESINKSKPHPEAFEMAFNTLNLRPQDKQYVCAFEDHPRGIESAKQAGLFTLGFAIRHTKKELLSLKNPPDFVYSNYKELFNYFIK